MKENVHAPINIFKKLWYNYNNGWGARFSDHRAVRGEALMGKIKIINENSAKLFLNLAY